MTESAYLKLKLSRQLFSKSPDALEPPERERVAGAAARQMEIERRILASGEAAGVVLPASSVRQGLGEIRGRYASEDEFRADLARTGLTAASLEEALARDLKVETVLERISSQVPRVTEADVEIFYLLHRERFRRPETRRLRHILITINDSLGGNERPAALAKIEAIRERLARSPGRFEEQAAKHSECPMAMHGGLLGQVPRGELYAELEPAAFALAVGELSAVVESPLGFHVLRCDGIEAEGFVPLAEVGPRLREHLEDARRRQAQKNWIATLFKAA